MGLFFWKFPKSSTFYVEKSKKFRFEGDPNQTLGYVGKCINCEPDWSQVQQESCDSSWTFNNYIPYMLKSSKIKNSFAKVQIFK